MRLCISLLAKGDSGTGASAVWRTETGARPIQRLNMGLCLALLAAQILRAAGPAVPELVAASSQDRTHPVWVDGDRAVRKGVLDGALFPPVEAEDLEYLVQNAQEFPEGMEGTPEEIARQVECESYQVLVTEPRPDESFPSLLAKAEFTFEGVVRDQQAGFLLGRPASLLQVEVTGVLKTTPEIGTPQEVLVSFGTAKLVVGDKLLCQRSPRYPDEPAVGGRILLFARVVVSPEPLIIVPDESAVFFETEGGGVSLPRGAEPPVPPSWSFIEERLRELNKPGASR